MASVVFYFQVHQPYRLRRYTIFDSAANYFDDHSNETICRKVAELQGMTVEDCRSQIDAECKIQTDMSLDEWQASRPGRKSKRDRTKEPRPPRRDEHISELDRRIEKGKD